MRLTVNGLDHEISYDRRAIEDLLIPFLRGWLQQTDDRARHWAYLVAPPGAGKSTLALLLQRHFGDELACLGIDGFHYRSEVLASRSVRADDGQQTSLASIKGAPETFDVAALDRLLERSLSEDVRWPVYDRRMHEPVPDALAITARHVLLEGNWLLLDEEPWRALRRYADVAIFIDAPPALLRERLVSRKVSGGLTRDAAEAFYERSDGPNVYRVLNNSLHTPVDLLLAMDADGALHERKATS